MENPDGKNKLSIFIRQTFKGYRWESDMALIIEIKIEKKVQQPYTIPWQYLHAAPLDPRRQTQSYRSVTSQPSHSYADPTQMPALGLHCSPPVSGTLSRLRVFHPGSYHLPRRERMSRIEPRSWFQSQVLTPPESWLLCSSPYAR